MISPEHTDTHDELRARFTSWLDTTIYRARLKYLAKEANRIPCISLDAVSEECLWSFDDYQFAISREHQFDFEEERLAKAFANLPVQRQQILTMLFVEERKPDEIARLLHCSVQHVYDQRYQTIRKLRKAQDDAVVLRLEEMVHLRLPDVAGPVGQLHLQVEAQAVRLLPQIVYYISAYCDLVNRGAIENGQENSRF